MNKYFCIIFLFVCSFRLFCQDKSVNYQNEKGKQGKWIIYNSDSSINAVFHFVNDTLNGPFIRNFPCTDTLSEKGFYKTGKPDGLISAYWKNGNIRSEFNVKDGILFGESKIYNRKWHLISHFRYIDGKIDTTFYFERNSEDGSPFMILRLLLSYIYYNFPRYDTITITDSNNMENKKIFINNLLIEDLTFNNNMPFKATYYKYVIQLIYDECDDYQYKTFYTCLDRTIYYSLEGNIQYISYFKKYYYDYPYKIEYYNKQGILMEIMRNDFKKYWWMYD